MDLYSPIIKELNNNPPNFGESDSAGHTIKAFNSYCGDKFLITLDFNGAVDAVLFSGYGCAVSKASCAILTEKASGLTWSELESMCNRVVTYFNEGGVAVDDIDERLVDFAVVRKYPGRHECAALAWKEVGEYASRMIQQER